MYAYCIVEWNLQAFNTYIEHPWNVTYYSVLLNFPCEVAREQYLLLLMLLHQDCFSLNVDSLYFEIENTLLYSLIFRHFYIRFFLRQCFNLLG